MSTKSSTTKLSRGPGPVPQLPPPTLTNLNPKSKKAAQIRQAIEDASNFNVERVVVTTTDDYETSKVPKGKVTQIDDDRRAVRDLDAWFGTSSNDSSIPRPNGIRKSKEEDEFDDL